MKIKTTIKHLHKYTVYVKNMKYELKNLIKEV